MHWRRRAGTSSTHEEFFRPRPYRGKVVHRFEKRPLAREIVEVIKRLPADEPVLLFTQKPQEHRRSRRRRPDQV